MGVTNRDCLVRNGARSGALGGIRTHDTWFRRPIAFTPRGHSWPRLVPFATCAEALNRPLVPFGTKQSQRAHGQQMVKDAFSRGYA